MTEPERRDHPTLRGWQFDEIEHKGTIILRGYRKDTPAALPLIVAAGTTPTSASQQFTSLASQWHRDTVESNA